MGYLEQWLKAEVIRQKVLIGGEPDVLVITKAFADRINWDNRQEHGEDVGELCRVGTVPVVVFETYREAAKMIRFMLSYAQHRQIMFVSEGLEEEEKVSGWGNK